MTHVTHMQCKILFHHQAQCSCVQCSRSSRSSGDVFGVTADEFTGRVFYTHYNTLMSLWTCQLASYLHANVELMK